MAYQSLYRRYRSQRFDEVLGQGHVTGAIKNAVREGRVGQGYLFSGPRGTGKTSTARILAKVLNCAAPVDGEPCTTCEACEAVQTGRGVDWLQELDAASNNRVDDMRELLSRVSMGTSGNRKVYILDEVHMLSAGASNALLKTLEEPPAHVIFVLATTEPEKVLPTIRSRTQHFDFHLLGAEVLAEHVRHIIEDAGLGLGEDAIDYVVRAGRGSARDTLSALDQVAAAGGVPEDAAPVDDILTSLVARDASAVLLAVESAARTGRDPRVLAAALIETLRQSFLVAMGAPASGLTEAAVARAEETAKALGPATLTKALESIGTAVVEMRHAPDPRIPLEVALVQLARPDTTHDFDGMLVRIEALERALAGGATPAAPTPSPSSQVTTPSTATAKSTSADPPPSGPTKRGADAARAKLAAHGEAPSEPADAPTDDTAAPGSRPSLGGVKRAKAPADPAPRSVPAPPDRAPAAPSPEPASTPGPPAAGSSLPSVDELSAAWTGTILESLKGRAKALYKPGRFVEHDGRTARFALPNEPHLNNCVPKLDEVRGAIEAHFGRPIPLELVVAGGASTVAPESTAAAPGGPAATPSDDPEPDEDVDLAELTDAPDAETGGIAQLRDAFPGAELVEDQ